MLKMMSSTWGYCRMLHAVLAAAIIAAIPVNDVVGPAIPAARGNCSGDIDYVQQGHSDSVCVSGKNACAAVPKKRRNGSGGEPSGSYEQWAAVHLRRARSSRHIRGMSRSNDRLKMAQLLRQLGEKANRASPFVDDLANTGPKPLQHVDHVDRHGEY